MRPIRTCLCLLLSSVVLAACGGGSNDDGPGASGDYDARITRTEFGIPHIVADDFGSLGYGFGYAFAEDNVCVLLEDLLTIRGERARYFGRDGSYTIRASGSTANNVDSDFFWKLVATDEVVSNLRDTASREVRDATAGYAAGLNRYIRELQGGEHAERHQACRDAAWLTEISTDDMYRRYYRLSILAGASALTSEIANVTPPLLGRSDGSDAASVDGTDPERLRRAIEAGEITPEDMPLSRPLPIGSNMYALGGETTTTGQSMLFGNPHFPWSGTERLYAAHLTIPGELDIMGSTLYGVPAILIGFNNDFAWSHTVSTAHRFTFYQLVVNPLNPMEYFYEGELRRIEEVPLEIEVLEEDGSLSTETRSLYRSHFGPMVEISAAGLPVLGWDLLRGFTLRDANAENNRLLDQFFAWNRADSFDEFKRLHGEILGVPWVNTIATGPGAEVYYGDVTVVPNVTDEQKADCQSPIIGPLVDQLMAGLPVLRGNRAECEWQTDADAPAPGIFGPANLPTLERSDWVHNCNDSYWLTNPAEPLTGFDRIIGDENAERTLRTRLCILQIQDRLAGSDGLNGNRFSFEQLKDVTVSSQIYSARLARDAVLADLCDDNQPACDVIANWDGTGSPDSRGAHLWREFWREASGANNLWQTPFSNEDPVNTPRDLNTGALGVGRALGDAVDRIEGLGIALDAPLGELQVSGVNDADGAAIPVPGGEQFEGAFTIAGSGTLSENGYPVTFGNSYIHAVTWENGRVRAEGFVTYSQSTDPANPHFSDFTEAYAERAWHRFPFSRAEISAQSIREYRISE